MTESLRKSLGSAVLLYLWKHGDGSYPKAQEKIEEDPQKPKHIKTEWGKGYRFGQNT